MSEKQHLDLIEKLSREHKAVRVHMSAKNRALLWFVVHMSLITLISYLRVPFLFDIFTPSLVVESVLFLSLILLTGYISFLTMVPGALTKKNMIFAFTVFIAFIVMLFSGLLSPQIGNPEVLGRRHCELEIIAYSFIPLAHVLYLSKSGIYFNTKASFIIASGASACIPGMVMHLACAYNYKHILLFHIIPIFVVAFGFGTVFDAVRKKAKVLGK